MGYRHAWASRGAEVWDATVAELLERVGLAAMETASLRLRSVAWAPPLPEAAQVPCACRPADSNPFRASQVVSLTIICGSRVSSVRLLWPGREVKSARPDLVSQGCATLAHTQAPLQGFLAPVFLVPSPPCWLGPGNTVQGPQPLSTLVQAAVTTQEVTAEPFFVCLKDFTYLFLEKGKGREKDRSMNVWLPVARPSLGTWPAIQTYVLTGSRIGDPLVLRLALSPLSHARQGQPFYCIVKGLHETLLEGDYGCLWPSKYYV